MAVPRSSISAAGRLLPCSLLFLLLLCIAGYYTVHLRNRKQSLLFDPRRLFLDYSDASLISDTLRSLTREPHVAGTEGARRTTQYVVDRLRGFGLDTHVAEFRALLSYPAGADLSARFGNGTIRRFSRVAEAGRGVVVPYHAYSPSGAAHAPAVFINYGREEDYRALTAMGVNVSGCVAVVRRGGGTRGAVVDRAARKGVAAVLMYTDREAFRDGVERGTVLIGVGDPLTPGWASVGGGEALDPGDPRVSQRFPAIPSMPISAEDAAGILESLAGPPSLDSWKANNRRYKGTRVGPGPTLVNFTYKEDRKMEKVYDVLAIIKGREEPDQYVLLGNHRDAWTYGAVDPSSGTAVMLDIAHRFGLLLQKGWVPRRTIMFCSWDAEEFGLIGSTEWVEQNLDSLSSKAVAYLNVDCAVQGPGLFVRASPQLDKLLFEVMQKIHDPDTDDNSVYQAWSSMNNGINIDRLSEVDSDFAAFVQRAGVPSVDLYYGKDFPVYHTAFDSFEWMERYGDPFFRRHVAVAEIWGLLGLRLADDPILPFDYLSYVAQLEKYMKKLSVLLNDGVSLFPMEAAIEELMSAARTAEEKAKKLGEWKSSEGLSNQETRLLNGQLIRAERGFLDTEGIKEREWFKHLIYGPPSDYGTKLDFFPGIADAISRAKRTSEGEGQALIQHEIWRVARAIRRAATALRGDIT